MTTTADPHNNRLKRPGSRAALPDPDVGSGAGRGPGPGHPVAPPPKLRRRPMLVAASVAAICLGALLAAWAYTSSSEAQTVLAIRTTVHRGEVISRTDVMTARIGVDPALHPIPASELDSVVGKRAALDLAAGGLVTGEDVTSSVVPAAGDSVVGISLAAGMLPAQRLQAGDRVRLVVTPGAQGEIGSGQPQSTTATVVGVQPPGDNGVVVVDVTVPDTDAAQLASWAATGKVALVLDSREH